MPQKQHEQLSSNREDTLLTWLRPDRAPTRLSWWEVTEGSWQADRQGWVTEVKLARPSRLFFTYKKSQPGTQEWQRINTLHTSKQTSNKNKQEGSCDVHRQKQTTVHPKTQSSQISTSSNSEEQCAVKFSWKPAHAIWKRSNWQGNTPGHRTQHQPENCS